MFVISEPALKTLKVSVKDASGIVIVDFSVMLQIVASLTDIPEASFTIVTCL